jgi:methyl-accepting chemotaxis protein
VKIKFKLLLGVTGMVLFIMICSTVAVYLLLNKQNHAAVQQNLVKTIDLVKDDLNKRHRKQARDADKAVTVNKIGDGIKFIADFAGQLSITRGSYLDTTAAMVRFTAASDLWQTAVYDQEGALLAAVQAMPDGTITATFVHDSNPPTFEHARMKAGVPINEVDWQTSDVSVLPAFGNHLAGDPVAAKETVQHVIVDGAFCLRTTTPVHANVFNLETEAVEPRVFGTVVCWQRLDKEFVKTLAKLSGMDINLFSAQGESVTGTLSDYGRLPAGARADADTKRTADDQALVSAEIVVDDRGYLQAALPLHDGSRTTGWVCALISKKIVVANSRQMVMMMGLVYLGCLVVVIPLVYLFAASFSRLVASVVAGLKDIAQGEGDLTRRLPIKSRDELGDLAHWFNIFIERLQGIIGNITENANHLASAAAGLKNLSETMASGAIGMSDESEAVSSASEAVSQSTASIAAAMEQSSVNLSTVASAAEEMTATINEIVRNTEVANQITGNAVKQVNSASQRVSILGNAAREIGKVTETITEISDQTNLLALNATIEAARAGEAGKGFAVVANEIKELARQTATATAEIKSKIDGIQQTTVETVAEIENITGVIHEVSQIVTTISTAVGEQSNTTEEIAGNVAQASQGVNEVNEKVAESNLAVDQVTQRLVRVKQAANEISTESGTVNENTHALSRLAEELNHLVGGFKV